MINLQSQVRALIEQNELLIAENQELKSLLNELLSQHTIGEENIKAMMVLRDVPQVAIAKQLGISRQAVSQVVSGKLKTPRVRRFIADKIGLQYELLWPENNGHNHKRRAA